MAAETYLAEIAVAASRYPWFGDLGGEGGGHMMLT